MARFTELVDLASSRVGGAVLFANDDFFAPKENLLEPEAPVFLPDRYTDRGKWMDGWESRRRRTPGHDFCVVRLGLRGVVHGVDVDTSHFTGNFPEAASLDATDAPEGTPLEELGSGDVPWIEILPRSALRGDTRNLLPVSSRRPFSHVRLAIHPDGGVARLRVHGEVVPDWKTLSARREAVDLCALENGGLVLASSDSFFGSHQSLLMPGPASGMKDGWETKRSRRPGFDWVVVRLGTRGSIARAVVDTSHFKGNFPDRASLEICDAPLATVETLADSKSVWQPVLPETPLAADTVHSFEKELFPHAPGTHVRLRIYPDGGVSRLRLYGAPRLPEAVARLNAASREDVLTKLASFCGSRRFSSKVEEGRPYWSYLELLRAVDSAFEELLPEDWLEAFRAHPRIGDRGAAGSAASEQAAALVAAPAVLERLRLANAEYEKRFGHLFIVCASGRPADALLANLEERLANPPPVELGIAAEEQRKITRLRVEKFLAEGA